MRVQFITKQGLLQIREVPEGSAPEQYQYGILIGPPDLSDLDLPKDKISQLVWLLVEKGFGNYNDTRGRRPELMNIIAAITGNRDKDLLKQILYLYQSNFFEE